MAHQSGSARGGAGGQVPPASDTRLTFHNGQYRKSIGYWISRRKGRRVPKVFQLGRDHEIALEKARKLMQTWQRFTLGVKAPVWTDQMFDYYQTLRYGTKWSVLDGTGRSGAMALTDPVLGEALGYWEAERRAAGRHVNSHLGPGQGGQAFRRPRTDVSDADLAVRRETAKEAEDRTGLPFRPDVGSLYQGIDAWLQDAETRGRRRIPNKEVERRRSSMGLVKRFLPDMPLSEWNYDRVWVLVRVLRSRPPSATGTPMTQEAVRVTLRHVRSMCNFLQTTLRWPSPPADWDRLFK